MSDIVSQTKPAMTSQQGVELLQALLKAGLTRDMAQAVIESKNGDFAASVVEFIRTRDTSRAGTNQEMARATMGRNFFGIEEAVKHFGVRPTKEQLDLLENIPFSEETLRRCKETHVLVAVFPLSILEIRDRVKPKLFSKHHQTPYFREFATTPGVLGWYLVCKEPDDYSSGRSFPVQEQYLLSHQEIPSAPVMVYAIIGHVLITDTWLFENKILRTSTTDGDVRATVGVFQRALRLNTHLDCLHLVDLGLATAEKPNT